MKIIEKDLEKVQRCPVCNVPLVRVSKWFVCPDGLDHTKLITLDDSVRKAHQRGVKGALLMDISKVAKRAKPKRPVLYAVDGESGLFERCYGNHLDAVVVRVKISNGWNVFFVVPEKG